MIKFELKDNEQFMLIYMAFPSLLFPKKPPGSEYEFSPFRSCEVLLAKTDSYKESQDRADEVIKSFGTEGWFVDTHDITASTFGKTEFYILKHPALTSDIQLVLKTIPSKQDKDKWIKENQNSFEELPGGGLP